MASTTTASPTLITQYKGKITHRSWQQLPPEIIRSIATYYLFDVSRTNYTPLVWDTRENWPLRIVYTTLRDANDLENLMRICTPWHLALEHHLFWHQATNVIDPLDTLGHHAIIRPPPTQTQSAAPASAAPSTMFPLRLPPYRHFRNITNCTCFICRINSPYTSVGLTLAKRAITSPFLGPMYACRAHRKHTFCGLCLREAPPLECETEYNSVCCVENEDEETWPGVDATCRSCRSEWLWRRVSNSARDREAVGGHRWESDDWETRQAVESFIEMGEGTISYVVVLAQEKHWLRTNTKLPDMLSQALAASRYASREEEAAGLTTRDGGGGGYAYESEDEDASEEGDEEDDPELLSLTEDAGGVRELAMSDWARKRILDGHWFSPADQWYGNTVNGRGMGVRAVHPCEWTVEVDVETNTDANADANGAANPDADASFHPLPSTLRGPIPPSFALCERAYVAFQKQMRLILLPAMRNLVRRLVIECAADGVDVGVRVARMGLDDVMDGLREEGVWFQGIDWLERRVNGGASVAVKEGDGEREPAGRGREREDDDEGSSVSSKGSHTTSPVLSTSTLQTTPSPPPIKDVEEHHRQGEDDRHPERQTQQDQDAHREQHSREQPPHPLPPSIPVTPVLASPVLLHSIPYIPVTIAHLPHYSMESIRTVWREASSVLYHCRCSICERAMVKANAQANVNGDPLTHTASVGVDQNPGREGNVHTENFEQPVRSVGLEDVVVEVRGDEEGEEEVGLPEGEYYEEEESGEEQLPAQEEEESSSDDVASVQSVEYVHSGSGSGEEDAEEDEDDGRVYLRYAVTPRKRASGELDEEHRGVDLSAGLTRGYTARRGKGRDVPGQRARRSGGPPSNVTATGGVLRLGGYAHQRDRERDREESPPGAKRVKRDGLDLDTIRSPALLSPRKRGSAELEVDGMTVVSGLGGKRAKTGEDPQIDDERDDPGAGARKNVIRAPDRTNSQAQVVLTEKDLEGLYAWSDGDGDLEAGA